MRFQLNGKLYEPQTLLQLGSSGYVHVIVDDEQKRRCILAIKTFDLAVLTQIVSEEIDLTGFATLLTLEEHIEMVKRIAR
jgi:hypothetical protein